jgi:hypothetical protein
VPSCDCGDLKDSALGPDVLSFDPVAGPRRLVRSCAHGWLPSSSLCLPPSRKYRAGILGLVQVEANQ